MRLVELALGRLTDRPRASLLPQAGEAICGVTLPSPQLLTLPCRCSDGRSGTVMVTGLPVRGSNSVMVIRTSHNSTLPSRRAGCHVGGTLAVPGKAHLPWIVCWSCAEHGRPRDPVVPHGGPRAYRTSASGSRPTQPFLYARVVA